jgi:NTP pyrophosphatase (non-canonical NTP hydrolase)
MTTLADIEEQVLEELGEDTGSLEVWTGSPDLREAIADAVDEVSMTAPYFQTDFIVKLEANIAFYELSLEDGYPLYVRSARIMDRDTRLVAYTMGQLILEDRQFLLSRGTPRGYASLAPDIVMVAPCNSTTTDVLKLSLVYAPRHYGQHNEFVTIREELEKGLIHYGKYHKLLQVKGSFREAMSEYEEYLRTFGLTSQMKEHAQALRRLRFSEGGNRAYGQEVR